MNNQLTLTYLISYILEEDKISIEKKKYLIESYPSLRLNYPINFDIFILIILIATKKYEYNFSDDYNVIINNDIINKTKENILDYIKNINNLLINKQKIESLIKTNTLNSNVILILSKYYNINILIFNLNSKITKCFYYDDYCNTNNPFIVIRESNILELLLLNNKYLFNYSHPIIVEISDVIYTPHFNNLKKEFKIKNDKIEIKLLSLKIIKFINKLKTRKFV